MANVLETLSNDLAATVQAASPAVVRVEGRRRVPATGVIWSADGLIVTAHHVVRRDERITIGLPDGSTRPAAVVGRDPSTDLAVLRVEGGDLTPAAWASGDGLGVGQVVLSHLVPGGDELPDVAYSDGVRKFYTGPVTVAKDLMEFH